ncbi:hypothetical protein L7F22_051005 [Adiantum nelumboides]|nr:hypothetical protein [Adiantum nelumboides]
MKKDLSVYLVLAREVSDCDESNLSVLGQCFYNSSVDCFSASYLSQLPPERPEDHAIDLVPGNSPQNRPPYKVSAAQQKEIMSQIEELLEKGLIQPNSSPFCSPVLLVQNNNGSWRMCIDYRALNKNTIKNRFPIPRIDDILDKLEGAAMFSRIDLKIGYHQIRIRSADVHKTAFRTTFGLYKFLVMPLGLTNALATFNRMMDRIFYPHQQFVGTFFDDMIVYSRMKRSIGITWPLCSKNYVVIGCSSMQRRVNSFWKRFTFWETASEWILLRYYVLAPLSLFPKAVELIVGGDLADQHMYHKYEMSVSRTNPLLLLGWHYCIGATIFLWGWVHQYRCHSILASLRANETMKNEHSQYKIPYGDWFEHVSCAHYLAEFIIERINEVSFRLQLSKTWRIHNAFHVSSLKPIRGEVPEDMIDDEQQEVEEIEEILQPEQVIYLGFIVATKGSNMDTWLLFIFVVLNLSIAAGDSHKWYERKFKNYPPFRKAVIPYIY